MMKMQIPPRIAEMIGDKPYRTDDIGRSDSSVLLFDEMVLKIEKTGEVPDNEYAVLRWLHGKLPAPRVLAFERENGYNYLLMTRISGKMACDGSQDPETIVKGLAAGLKMLWNTDTADCPRRHTIGDRLAEAKTRLESGYFDGKAPEAEGFADFASLYAFLSANRPNESLVFSHGDYCLPNIFLDGEEPVGFLDLGQAGVADKWYDIDWCLWSMHYNFCEFFGMSEEEYEPYRALLFEELGIACDAETLRYHQLLDMFFE